MLRVGICGPANPYEFKTYLNNQYEIPNVNNQAASVNAHIQSLLDEGCEVIVFTKQKTDNKDVIHLCGNKIQFFIVPEKDNRQANIFRFHTINTLKKLIRNNIPNIDILHAQWTYEYAYACIPYSDKIPTFCTVRDWCPYQRHIARRPMEILVWTVNSFLFHQVLSCKKIHFIANSEYTLKCLEKYGIGNDITKINNGIKSQFILDNRAHYPTTPTFVSIAQDLSEKRKNIITLLKAFQQLCQKTTAKLILVGKISKSDFQAWEEAGLLRHVIFTGAINHNQVIDLLDECSTLVHPSIEETFGNILLEGMARRIPVIGGSHSGAVPNVLGNGNFGVLCDILDTPSLRRAMQKTIPFENVSKTIDDATLYLRQNFSSDVIGKKHLELYKKAICHEL